MYGTVFKNHVNFSEFVDMLLKKNVKLNDYETTVQTFKNGNSIITGIIEIQLEHKTLNNLTSQIASAQ